MFWATLGLSLQPVLGALDSITPSAKAQPVVLPRKISPQPETPKTQVEQVIERLDLHKGAWVRVSCAERYELLRRTLLCLSKVEKDLATALTTAKGSYGAGVGEERVAILPIVFAVADYMVAMRAEGQPKPLKVEARPDGQLVATVLPQGPMGLLVPNFRGEVWLQPGQPASQGAAYRRKREQGPGEGGVALVLGAGNQVAVVGCDILHKLLTDDEVVVVKTNPVNDYVGPLLRKAFAPFVEANFVEFVYGGREVGEQLTSDPRVTSIHLTGSADTYNAIVWGSPTAKREGPTRLPPSKHITAELGNVTPYIVVPGGDVAWSQSDIEYHAATVATALAHNAGHNCIALEVLVTDSEWPQRAAFLAAVRAALGRLPQRQPFYPGAKEKYDRFRQRFPDAAPLGQPVTQGSASSLPYLMAEGLQPEAAELGHENWCTVFQEVSIPGCGGDPAKFMAAAAQLANERVWGSLAVGVIAHPQVQTAHAAAWDGFISSLRYGSIAVNVPVIFLFGQTQLTWGAFPGNTPQDIESGVGVVHNTLLFDHPQKSVLYGPWRYKPKPFWLVDNVAAGEDYLVPYVIRFAQAVAEGNAAMALLWVSCVATAALRG